MSGVGWDGIIGVVIIVGLVLAIWAKVSQQTITELLRDIRDIMSEKKEEVVEKATVVYT